MDPETHPMNDSSALLCDSSALRDALSRDGYLFLPGLIDRSAVLAGLSHVLAVAGAGLEATGNDFGHVSIVRGAASGKNSTFCDGIVATEHADELMVASTVQKVLGSAAVVTVFERLFGEDCVAFDHKWFRIVAPGGQTHFHMDSVFFGRSQEGGPLDAELLTLWFPWNDLSPAVGGLLLLEGSHRLPGFECMRRTYGQQFDACRTDIQTPYIADRREQLQWYDARARWVSGALSDQDKQTGCYHAGDVVIFHRHCVHGSTKNSTVWR